MMELICGIALLCQGSEDDKIKAALQCRFQYMAGMPAIPMKKYCLGRVIIPMKNMVWGHYVHFPYENIGFLTPSTIMYKKSHVLMIVCIKSRTVVVTWKIMEPFGGYPSLFFCLFSAC